MQICPFKPVVRNLSRSQELMRAHSGALRRVRFIIPWNFPLQLVGWGIAPALAAAHVVVKPPEEPRFPPLFLRLAKEAGIQTA